MDAPPPPQDDPPVSRGRRFAIPKAGLESMQRANEVVLKFRDSQVLDEKIAAAQEIQRLIADGETNPEVKTMLQEFARTMKPDKFLAMAKTVKDLQLVSDSARSFLGGEEGGPAHRGLDDLASDDTLDPKAKAIATQFAQYLPISKNATKLGKNTEVIGNGMKYHANSGGKPHILDGDGNIVIRPGASSDPRQVAIIANTFEDLLTGKTDQPSANGGMPKKLDDLNGRPLFGSNLDGSQLTKGLVSGMLEQSRDLDGDRITRLNKWLDKGQKDMDPKGKQPKMEVTPRGGPPRRPPPPPPTRSRGMGVSEKEQGGLDL